MIAYLYLQVYTIDKFYQQFSTVGHALLNVFVKSGTERQPTSDDAATQVSHVFRPELPEIPAPDASQKLMATPTNHHA